MRSKRKEGAVALACRSETSRGDRITQRLDANREGKHRAILEEKDSREEGGIASREHIEGRPTRCMEEEWGWIDLHCDMGRKLTFFDWFLCEERGSGSKTVSELTNNYPDVYDRDEPFSELQASLKSHFPFLASV
jgi:hypothetical protein